MSLKTVKTCKGNRLKRGPIHKEENDETYHFL